MTHPDPYQSFADDELLKEHSAHPERFTRTKTSQEFWLAFDIPISKQLRGRVLPEDAQLLDDLSAARKLLLDNGLLPGRRVYAVEKQIVLKARRCMTQFKRMQP